MQFVLEIRCKDGYNFLKNSVFRHYYYSGRAAALFVLSTIALAPIRAQTTTDEASGFPAYVDVSECNPYRLQNDYPLSAKQRACTYAGNLISASGFLGAGAGAGWAQLMKQDPKEWGSGPAGYGHSYGSRYAAGVAKASAEYLTAALFREDPRPRRSKSPNWKDRVLDAATNLVLDTGRSAPRPAYHTIAGALSSGFTGMAFYPARENTVKAAFARAGMSFGGSLAYAELYEFEPDLFHLVGKWFSPRLKKQ